MNEALYLACIELVRRGNLECPYTLYDTMPGKVNCKHCIGPLVGLVECWYWYFIDKAEEEES